MVRGRNCGTPTAIANGRSVQASPFQESTLASDTYSLTSTVQITLRSVKRSSAGNTNQWFSQLSELEVESCRNKESVLTVPILFPHYHFLACLLIYLYSFNPMFHYDFKFFLFFCKLSNHLSINHVSIDWLIVMRNLDSLMIARTVRSLLHIVRPRCLH